MNHTFQKYLIRLDANLNIVKAEDDFLRYIGMPSLTSLDEVIPPQDMMLLKNAVFAINTGGNTLSCFRIRTSSGNLNWIAANVEKLDDKDHPIQMELSDIQSLKTAGTSGVLDPMTGLLNKKSITDMAIELTKDGHSNFYFALLDIDHFKRVNDTYGHKRGDAVIIEVAHLIRDIVGPDGTVGRIGGDEFMIILENVNKRPRLREIMNELKDTIENHYNRSEDDLHLTISVGVTLYPDYSVDYNELFTLTDKLLYRAKEKGRNRYVIYTPEVHAHIRGGEDEAKYSTDKKVYTEKEKHRLIMDLMERFLLTDKTNIDVALSNVILAYNLDEIHICLDGSTRSHYGVRRAVTAENPHNTELYFAEFPQLEDQDAIQDVLNENNCMHIASDTCEELKDSPIKSMLMQQNSRYIFIYRMAEARTPGYVLFFAHRNNNNRMSEADMADFLYFSRMIELITKTR
ncbi:MAG: GGDEF domain-containing protein [Lachnospiraceae bacterium]|nr:GGDEF domain-containing protein [Lachnospiraceae bacterium]